MRSGAACCVMVALYALPVAQHTPSPIPRQTARLPPAACACGSAQCRDREQIPAPLQPSNRPGVRFDGGLCSPDSHRRRRPQPTPKRPDTALAGLVCNKRAKNNVRPPMSDIKTSNPNSPHKLRKTTPSKRYRPIHICAIPAHNRPKTAQKAQNRPANKKHPNRA